MSSIIAWLKSLFSPQGSEDGEIIEDDRASSAWTEHLRVVLAILVVAISACVIWWILA